MTISITINGENAGMIQAELRALLAGTSLATGNVGQVATGSAESNAAPKRLTAAEKKAAEKAAQESAGNTGQGISLGEERVETAEDKQDAKDEAAEKPAAPVKLTHDSIRAMLGGYVQAYGMAAAQEDGVKLIGTAKISDLKDDQAVFAKAVIEIATGIEKNPHKRDIAGDGITAEKLAELKPIVAAAIAVK